MMNWSCFIWVIKMDFFIWIFILLCFNKVGWCFLFFLNNGNVTDYIVYLQKNQKLFFKDKIQKQTFNSYFFQFFHTHWNHWKSTDCARSMDKLLKLLYFYIFFFISFISFITMCEMFFFTFHTQQHT